MSAKTDWYDTDPYYDHSWFGSRFEGEEFQWEEEVWRIEKLIKERVGEKLDGPSQVCEAVGVFVCKHISGKLDHDEAIAKIFMQIPNVPDVDDLNIEDSSVYADQALPSRRSWAVKIEVDTLSALTKAQCPSSPQLFCTFNETQADDMPLSGGYLFTIMMQKLPGVPLSSVWHPRKVDAETRKRMQAAAKAAIIYLVDFESAQSHKMVWTAEEEDKFFCWYGLEDDDVLRRMEEKASVRRKELKEQAERSVL